jgi:hypothetical protein
VTIWFQNNVRDNKAGPDADTRKGTTSYIRTYTTRDACKSLFKDKIHDLVVKKTDDKPGGKGWLQFYATALGTVFNNLDDDELHECTKLAEKWNTEGLSSKEQQR